MLSLLALGAACTTSPAELDSLDADLGGKFCNVVPSTGAIISPVERPAPRDTLALTFTTAFLPDGQLLQLVDNLIAADAPATIYFSRVPSSAAGQEALARIHAHPETLLALTEIGAGQDMPLATDGEGTVRANTDLWALQRQLDDRRASLIAGGVLSTPEAYSLFRAVHTPRNPSTGFGMADSRYVRQAHAGLAGVGAWFHAAAARYTYESSCAGQTEVECQAAYAGKVLDQWRRQDPFATDRNAGVVHLNVTQFNNRTAVIDAIPALVEQLRHGCEPGRATTSPAGTPCFTLTKLDDAVAFPGTAEALRRRIDRIAGEVGVGTTRAASHAYLAANLAAPAVAAATADPGQGQVFLRAIVKPEVIAGGRTATLRLRLDRTALVEGVETDVELAEAASEWAIADLAACAAAGRCGPFSVRSDLRGLVIEAPLGAHRENATTDGWSLELAYLAPGLVDGQPGSVSVEAAPALVSWSLAYVRDPHDFVALDRGSEPDSDHTQDYVRAVLCSGGAGTTHGGACDDEAAPPYGFCFPDFAKYSPDGF